MILDEEYSYEAPHYTAFSNVIQLYNNRVNADLMYEKIM
jgi:hypothetical protein